MGQEFPAFTRQLLDYPPTIMRNVAELQQIMLAEQPELVEAWKSAQRALDEQFIETESEYGVLRWEKIMGLKVRPGDTLEDRKDRILLTLRVRLPYTIRWLRNWLDENAGPGNSKVEIDRYTIDLWLNFDTVTKTLIIAVLELLGWLKPANMVLAMTGRRTKTGIITIAAYPEQQATIEVGGMRRVVDGRASIRAYPEMQINLEIGGT